MQKASIGLFKKSYLSYKANEICRKCLSLPIYPSLKEERCRLYMQKIKEFYD